MRSNTRLVGAEGEPETCWARILSIQLICPRVTGHSEVSVRFRLPAGESMLEDAMEGKEPAVGQPKDALGVLLVYGVGRQAQGETLIAAANPIYEFLNRLPGTKGKVDMVDCFLRPRFAPAHLRLQFHGDVEGRSLTESWLMAEANWAESFPAGCLSAYPC